MRNTGGNLRRYPPTFLYNFFSCLLRSMGNSTVPLVLVLAVSAVLNIGLDLFLVLVIPWGVAGAAIATVISQYVSGVGIAVYTLVKRPDLRPAPGPAAARPPPCCERSAACPCSPASSSPL